MKEIAKKPQRTYFIRSYLKNGKLALKPKLGASEWISQTNNGQL